MSYSNCLYASTVNLDAAYATPSGGLPILTLTATGLLVLDNQTVLLNDVVLIKNQSTHSHNGIYTCSTAGAIGVNAVLTRFAGFVSPNQINSFGLISVLIGDTQGNTGWIVEDFVPAAGGEINFLQCIDFNQGENLITLYVDGSEGSDSTGVGSAVRPFATITKANSVILDNATGKRYTIRFTGASSEANLKLKPWTSIIGDSVTNSQITITGTGSLGPDVTWDGLVGAVSSVSNVSFIGGTAIDFQIQAYTGSAATLYFSNVVVDSVFLQGRASSLDTVHISNMTIGASGIVTIDFNGVSNSSYYQGAAEFAQSNSTDPIGWISNNDTFTTDIIVQKTSDNITFNAYASSLQGGLTVTSAGAVANLDPVSYPHDGLSLVAGGAYTSSTTIQGVTIGSDIPSTGAFTTLSATGVVTATAAGCQSWRVIGSNTYTGATYTFALTDQDTFVQFNRATTQTVTVPTNASVAFPIGTEIDCIQIGAGQVTFAAAGGVTLNSKNSALSLSARYSAATLKKTGSDTWDLVGDLTNGGNVIGVTNVTGSTYVTLASDNFIAYNRAGAIAVTLIASPVTGQTYIHKDISGGAAGFNITLTPTAGLIDGAASYVMNTNYGSVTTTYNGTGWSIS